VKFLAIILVFFKAYLNGLVNLLKATLVKINTEWNHVEGWYKKFKDSQGVILRIKKRIFYLMHRKEDMKKQCETILALNNLTLHFDFLPQACN